MRKQPARATIVVDSGDVEARIESAADTVRATCMYPFQMHGSIGSSCAVADSDGKATVWAASQNVYALRGARRSCWVCHPRPCTRIHAWFGLLRDQRVTPWRSMPR